MQGLLRGLVYGGLIITVLMTATAWGMWLERKLAARMQSRIGPNVVGKFGLLQPVADLMKLLQKEEIYPIGADRLLFDLAPFLVTTFAIATAAVVPFTAEAVGADLDVGILWVLALGGLMVIPVWMAGWASNNKFALIGGMRAVAQSVSYGVPLVLTSLVAVVFTGTMSLSGIVKFQIEHGWLALWPPGPGVVAFVLFYMALLAESNRIPFDIPEAESELVAGITTEYTGMKFGLLYVGEYVHTMVGSAIAAVIFLGGWDGPFHVASGLHWMVIKTVALFASVYWVRWSLLRFRSDQLMRLCWLYLVPVSLGLVIFAALWRHFVLR